jgi:hypothetical protein
MAKMFYTMDEAKAALGKTADEVKQLARDGKLREFRDGDRLMFKADQVEQLKAELGSGGGALEEVDLGPSDSGMAIGLADSKGSGIGGIGSGVGSGMGSGSIGIGSGIGSGISSGSGLSLADSEAGHSPGGGMNLKDDTALAADLGLSGSIGGVPSPGRPSTGSGTGLSGSQGSRPGIDVFQNDDIERVDPSAQTAISSGVNEQVNLDGVGSGSGLLDLTRESDDTSLGAELLDEIAPSGTGVARRSPGESVGGSAAMGGIVDNRAATGGISRGANFVPATIEKPDPMAPAFGGAALGATIVVLFGAFVLITGLLDTNPTIFQTVAKYGFLIIAGGALGVTVLFFLIGMVVGKAASK